ncbi:hypothetical protein BGZ65_006533 [Modicella reniformis]|uniref:Uncharacterized protein n=1 Tax=Modicella reniformis TaxID=1440133 RepID=A0A9P6JHE8_9FUNG|nr:hypothetical protein BGZ65_006533 [Modicella reniformis]
MPPELTGFLMADPYPSAGTRYLDGDGDQDLVSLDSQSEGGNGGDSHVKRTGSNASSSKKYKASPPPIPIEVANAKSAERATSGASTVPTTPTTPTTPLTPPGVRPRRSVDAVVDPQFLEMARKLYEDHVVPAHVMQVMSVDTPSSTISKTTASASSPEAPVILTAKSEIAPTIEAMSPMRQAPELPAAMSSRQLPAVPVPPQSPTQPYPPLSQQESGSPLQPRAVAPAKSPYRARESFESRITQGGSIATGAASGPYIPSQGVATPPSPTSTASPTIVPVTTLPRPLTPAWYETKTNFASTNEVLNHYNAVMRGGSYLKQQQQQQQQQQQGSNKQLYYEESAIGPLDDVAPASQTYNQQLPTIHSVQAPHQQQQQQQQQDQHQQDQHHRQTYSPQHRMGSADSFGVVRPRSSSGKNNHPHQSIVAHHELHEDVQRYQQHQVGQRNPQQLLQLQQPVSQLDRHSFMMPSEHLPIHSTWTGDLSDVTNTSGEVSVGAFVDRKHPGPHQQHHRRKSADESEPKDKDIRKSQASAYSMGSCFGVGSSSAGSRQSAGACSTYSNNSGFGSGSIHVSASLSPVGHGGNGESTLSPSSSSPHKQHSGSIRKRSSDNRSGSGHGHGTLNERSGSTGSTGSSGSSNGNEGGGGSHGNGSKEMSAAAPNRMNSMRLSAFGSGEDVDIPMPTGEDDGIPRDANVEAQTPQDLERKIQQAWMDRRAAVKKDSKNRLEQLHKQQQVRNEQEHNVQEQQHQHHRSQQRDRQQHYLQSQIEQGRREQQEQEDTASGEPYTLNSVYFKSSGQPSPGTAAPDIKASYSSSRADSAHMHVPVSSVSGTLPGEPAISTPSTTTASGIIEPSSPSPNAQIMFLGSQAPTSRPHESPTSSYSSHNVVEAKGEEGSDSLHVAQTIPSNPSLLHYDSVDSIATIRATHRYPPLSPSPSSPPPQRPSSSRSGSSLPSSPSPSPILQRPLYAQYPSQQTYYPSQLYYQQQQSQQSQQSSSPRASISQVGPSQYRIVPDDVVQRAANTAMAVGDDSAASRSLSPTQRTSSRLTNLTSTGSDYQWESAELNQHQWEMLGATPGSSTRNN